MKMTIYKSLAQLLIKDILKISKQKQLKGYSDRHWNVGNSHTLDFYFLPLLLISFSFFFNIMLCQWFFLVNILFFVAHNFLVFWVT